MFSKLYLPRTSRETRSIPKSKTVNGQTTNFNWDASGNLVRESDSSGNTLANYYYDAIGNLVGLKKNNQSYVYHNNLRGDIVSVTDYNGNIQSQYNYDPWGTQTSYSGTLSQPFRYAGYYYDEETGLYYLKNRYYSPALGRFLTMDSYGYVNHRNPQTLNLYTYANNNPVSNIDPNGNDIISTIISVFLGTSISNIVSNIISSSSHSSSSYLASSSSSSLILAMGGYGEDFVDKVAGERGLNRRKFGDYVEKQKKGFSRGH